ncbi:hypothetical protein [Streptacidiphilus sp. EB129]|uniref:hypothetical protein n=1 Tax=Streptacidiphilus sp. EB129 TaxID=3156262 RepID=UPI00351348EC
MNTHHTTATTTWRGLTIRPPWSTLITLGIKSIENRPWTTRYRGPLLIHAGRTLDRIALTLPTVTDALTTDQHHPGHIVAVAHLADCHPDDGPCTPWAQPAHHHLVLTDIRPLPQPIAHRGTLGLWKPPDDVLRQLADQLAG